MNVIRPDICVSIGNANFEEIKNLLPKFPLVELRVDLLDLSKDELKQLLALHGNLIITYRANNGNYELMLDMLSNAIEFGAAWVDVDIDTPDDIIKKVVAKARTKNCRVIISYHNFDKTPSTSIFNSIITSVSAYNPALTKIACMANSPNDCVRVLSLYENHSNILAFCMGQVGTITRIAAPILGAPFTYAGLPGKETAPGQIDYIKMNEILNSINQ